MEIVVVWTRFAEIKLQEVFNYYQLVAGTRTARNLVKGIVNATIDLQKQPAKGQIEPSLAHRPQNFRYLIYKNYKIIYRINDDQARIEIVNVFDCRRDPGRLKVPD